MILIKYCIYWSNDHERTNQVQRKTLKDQDHVRGKMYKRK